MVKWGRNLTVANVESRCSHPGVEKIDGGTCSIFFCATENSLAEIVKLVEDEAGCASSPPASLLLY